MRKSLRPEISPKQFDFIPVKGTRNAILTLSMRIERCIEMQKDPHLCFIDYAKAFDKLKHVELFRMLETLDIDRKDLRVIRNLYWDQTASVRIEVPDAGKHGSPMRKSSGVAAAKKIYARESSSKITEDSSAPPRGPSHTGLERRHIKGDHRK
ncbi:endonuclease-reverse transcriptase [Plakobranchus ocellatus]|uniref:Endonuclease-reverse transcriptase n=1 Tax=Plakobranchus ocellatus TaxID=259542 RepID=A0AAV3XZR6_9GAST|nr:endonuclease-reverse transcriptase [Plakobranchus ocellatus]